MSRNAEITVNETIKAVWDSELYTEHEVGAGIYWLDNETILVSANNGPKPTTSEERRAAEPWLYLWRLGEKPHPYGADPHIAAKSYCAAQGELSYLQDIVDPATGVTSRVRLLGPPGHERQVRSLDALEPGRAFNPLTIERISCEFYSDPAMAGKYYVTDSKHTFYLDLGRKPIMAAAGERPPEPIVLTRADGSGRVELPISNALVAQVYFHTFDGAFYLLNGNLTASPINQFEVWRKTGCWPIWRVDPKTAATERLCIPFGPWSGALKGGTATSLLLAPTKAGLFFAANPVRAAEDHGLYQLSNGVVAPVLPGYIWSPTISPDGCRVAFVHIPNDEAHNPLSSISSSIVVIDVCSDRSQVHHP